MTNASTFPSGHTFMKWQEPEPMAPDEPVPSKGKSIESMKYWLFRTSDLRFIPDPRLVDYVSEYKRCQRKETIPFKNTEDFLEILFPTKYSVEKGIQYKQKVSTEQVTREELKFTSELLDYNLKNRQSQSSTGFCPVRFSLHMELFDELTRQVSISSPSRAYMLDRVRGELNQTLDSFRKVLDVSLVEENKLVEPTAEDPELQLLQDKLDESEAEVATAQEEYNNALSDYQEVENKFELEERIKTQLHQPEIQLTQQLHDALVRQIYHFENPPSFEEEEEGADNL